MSWAYFALAVSALLFVAWVVQVLKRRWSWPGLVASIGCLVTASFNSAAPFRGYIDPDYVGYGFGLVSARPGIAVTLIAGSIFLASAASALIAAGRKTGRPLWIVSATCAALAIIAGLPTTLQAIRDPAGNAIQLGEYLTIPGWAGSLILIALMAVPFLVGTIWGARGAMAAEPASIG